VHHHGTTLYFAYGSNLNKRRMFERCPGATPVRAHELLGWKLVFRGTADIVPCFGHTVVGALYSVTHADIRELDRFEGAPYGRYRRKYFWVGRQRACTYVMNSSLAEEAPSAEYYSLIEQGYLDWNWRTSELVSAYDHVSSST
jgi:gamma-glutamylcyclotransferase (GGCT)/AIG2-like uncharacterized protein YtfP